MLELEWRPQADADLEALITYIAAGNPAAAQRLKDEILTKVAALRRRPQLYRPGRVRGTREMRVRRNYVVVYAERDDRIAVLRVMHAAQQWPPP